MIKYIAKIFISLTFFYLVPPIVSVRLNLVITEHALVVMQGIYHALLLGKDLTGFLLIAMVTLLQSKYWTKIGFL
jgi:hypothetical protein